MSNEMSAAQKRVAQRRAEQANQARIEEKEKGKPKVETDPVKLAILKEQEKARNEITEHSKRFDNALHDLTTRHNEEIRKKDEEIRLLKLKISTTENQQ